MPDSVKVPTTAGIRARSHRSAVGAHDAVPLTVTEVVRRSGVTHSGFVWTIIEGERAAMKDSEFEVVKP